MKVFFSWSGDQSKDIASAFKQWLRRVIQGVEPFFTPEIEKGARWPAEIAQKLDECSAGLTFLTRDNLTKPWILFEAGAISKSQASSHVYTILCGIRASDVGWPLAQFQATQFSRDEVLRLTQSLNAQMVSPLDPDILQDTFDAWWPGLEKEVNDILARPASEVQPATRATEDVLNDILISVRATEAAVLARLPQGSPDLHEFVTHRWGDVAEAIRPQNPQLANAMARSRPGFLRYGRTATDFKIHFANMDDYDTARPHAEIIRETVASLFNIPNLRLMLYIPMDDKPRADKRNNAVPS